MIKIALVSLGCEKNLVDSEMILGLFNSLDFEIIDDLGKANLIVINTCGFIDSAKEEAINTIYECLQYKENGAKVVVTGCLVERYLDELSSGIKDVDLWIPLRYYNKFGELIGELFGNKDYCNVKLINKNRVISTPKHLAYVKISDGCNNRCNYCAIPLIRGNFRSEPKDDILDQVKYLVKSGRKEICLISQDLTRYGTDINYSLEELLLEITKIPGDYKIRMLYLYPDEISDKLIEIVRDNDKIMPYFDIPVQHGSNKILKWMNRRGTKEFIKELVLKIRKEIPNSIIRTTMIVGFPHESEKDFKELIDFIMGVKFDHLGAFTYSKEEGTKGFDMNNQVPKKVKEKRLNELMEVQKYISLNLNSERIGMTTPCIIEAYDEESNTYYGRNYMYAPDDIDGAIIINSDRKLEIGEVVNIEIYEADFYDLYANVI